MNQNPELIIITPQTRSSTPLPQLDVAKEFALKQAAEKVMAREGGEKPETHTRSHVPTHDEERGLNNVCCLRGKVAFA